MEHTKENDGAGKLAGRILWKPQERQAEFFRRGEYEVLYGGAAGGGKSDALLVEALRQVEIPHYRGLILRKTFSQLGELLERSKNLYGRAFPGAKYNASEHIWRFPSGALISLGNMEDKTKYQGFQYDFIAFDELTHFTWDEYSYMISRNRAGGPGTRVYIRAATNPGGVGHAWVKDRFVTAGKPLSTIWETVQVHTPEGPKEVRRSRAFVPATVFDNAVLLRNSPGYLASMAMMPEAQRNALLYGSWDSFSGQVFREWRDDPQHYRDRLWTHVVEPFPVPKWWRIYRGFDFGYAKPFSVGWYAVDGDGRLYRIAEYYGCTGEPNVGLKITPDAIARDIRRIEDEDPNLRGRSIEGIADPSIFDESRGESIAAMMARGPDFVYWDPGDNKRVPGKMQYHYRLAFDEDGLPMFQVFNTCRHYIRTIPSLIYDEKHVEDIDTDGEDHIYDESRYVFMANPIAARENKAEKRPEWDPLDLYKDRGMKKKDPYILYRI